MLLSDNMEWLGWFSRKKSRWYEVKFYFPHRPIGQFADEIVYVFARDEVQADNKQKILRRINFMAMCKNIRELTSDETSILEKKLSEQNIPLDTIKKEGFISYYPLTKLY